jgi:uncharacterized membrane protein YgdD (TMEM256/DUF423 family)
VNKLFLTTGAAFCAISVIFGALGAHWLKGKVSEGLLTPENLQSFETGVKYQMYHGLALILVAIVSERITAPQFNYAGNLFIIGTILFSFSIYFLSTKGISGLTNLKFLGPVTPLGGLLMIAGWMMFIIGVAKRINS